MISLHGAVVRGELELELELDVERGISYVAGPNGAGKSTLLRVLAGLEALDSGELRIDESAVDIPARTHFVPTHQRPIAMAFQDHRLFPHLDVLDNVAFPGRRRGQNRHAAREGALAHLQAMGISELAHRLPGELSIGQQQRTALARALATPGSVLLLDEPLASIDEPSRPFIRNQLRAAPHRTTIWVSHDPTDLAPESSLISVDAGRVRQTRTP